MKEIINVNSNPEWLKSTSNLTCYTHKLEKAKGTKDEKTGKTIIKSGTIYPANDNTAIGIVRNDYDVTDGDVVGSLMVHGDVLEKRLPITITADAKKALIKQGIYFYSSNGETLVTPTE